MRQGPDRDAQDPEGRAARRRHYRTDQRHEDDEWHVPDDVSPASARHVYPDEVQRRYDRSPEIRHRHRSRHAPQPAMQPPQLARYASERYRRPQETFTYRYDDRANEEHGSWSPPRQRRQRSPDHGHRRRVVRPPREPSPASVDRPSTVEESLDEDQIEVVEEVDEEEDAEEERHRRHRHRSRDHRRESPEERRHRSRRRRASMPPRRHENDENDILVYTSDSASEPDVQDRRTRTRTRTPERHAPERHAPERHAPERHAPERYAPERRAPERRAPERRLPEERLPERPLLDERLPLPDERYTQRRLLAERPPLRRGASDPPPHRQRPQKAVSMFEPSRPPVASKRTTEIWEYRESHRDRDRDGRPRRSATVNAPRRSRSYSRRPQTIIGSLWGGSSRQTSPGGPPKIQVCYVCLTESLSTKCPKLKCGHRWCTGCLKDKFQFAIKDSTQMPPKCCDQTIPPRLVEKSFDRKFKKKWNRKYTEFSTRNRIYCPSRRCGEWIRPADIHRDRKTKLKVAECNRCGTQVCVLCNGKWHGGRKCPRDEETEKFLEQLKEESIVQRCHNCLHAVVLKEGCNHMTCRCGAEFCMICGTKWRSCECPLFSDDMGDFDQLDHMNVPKFVDDKPRKSLAEDVHADDDVPARSRSKNDGKLRRQKRGQERQKDGMAHRKPIYTEEPEYDEEMNGMVVMRNDPDPFIDDGYNHHLAPPLPQLPLTRALDGLPPHEYRDTRARDSPPKESKKARKPRDDSMERRLMDRFSENRQPAAAIAAPDPRLPMNPHPQGHMLVPPPPVGMPPMPGAAIPSGMPAMVPGVMPVAVPGVMTGPVPNGMYQPDIGVPLPMRVAVEHDGEGYEDDMAYQPHTPRGKKHRHREHREQQQITPSSTMAGLSGRGRGMGRVDTWRTFVEPGYPENEAPVAMVPA